MSDEKPNPEEIEAGAKELLKTCLTYCNTYCILYMVHRQPVEDSNYYVEKYKIKIPKLSKPIDYKNIIEAENQFRANRAPEIQKQYKDTEMIAILKAYVDCKEAKRIAYDYNNKLRESIEILRLANLKFD